MVDDKQATRRELEAAGVEIRPGPGLDFLDTTSAFTEADRVLQGMGLDLGKTEAALTELQAKNLA